MEKETLYPLFYEWLQPFLLSLPGKGILVSPDTHIQVLKVLEVRRGKITGENVLDYIAPVIVKNAGQLKILKDAYASFLSEQFTIPGTACRSEEPKPTKPWYQKYILVIPAAILAAFAIYYATRPSSPVEARASIAIRDNNGIKNPIGYSALPGLKNPRDTQSIRFTWDFGDGSIDSSSHTVKHIYTKPGKYQVSLKLAAISPNVKLLKTDTVLKISVCPPPVYITADSSGDVEINQEVQFDLAYDSVYPPVGQNTWFVNDSAYLNNSLAFKYVFVTPGDHSVRFSVADTTLGCTIENEIMIHVKKPDAVSFNLVQTGSLPTTPRVNIRGSWLWGLILLTGIPLLVLLWWRKNVAVRDKAASIQAKTITNKFKGQLPPFNVPFKNHDDLIEDEKQLLSVAQNYKRRSMDEAQRLDIGQTILSTIRSEGLLAPVWSSKTKPVEYLVLIDKTKARNQQVKLFEYLLKKFARNDLYIETFYYNFNPDLCFNNVYPDGIHLSRIHDLYPNHILIVFGTGYQFINTNYPALNESLLQFLRKWDNRAICTPVNLSDWDYREKILQRAAALFPADLNGQLLLFRLLENSGINYQEYLSKTDEYNVKSVNFANLHELQTYLKDPVLFQWVCGIAVYPDIQWEVLIAIGNALKKRRYPQLEINYTALLKLTRIEWMQEGSFPDKTRLELLKKLEPLNEKIARETMISMMEHAIRRTDETSFSFEQVRLQLLTDKFLLYAQDPSEKKYQEYDKEHEEFKTLWEKGKIHDYPLQTYLNKTAGGGSWSTLINNKDLSEIPGAASPMDVFFKNGLHVIKKKLYRAQKILFGISAVAAVLLAVLLVAQRWLNGSGIDKSLSLTNGNTDISVTFQLAFNDCLKYEDLKNDSTKFFLTLPGGRQEELNYRDTVLEAIFPYTWFKGSSIGIAIQSNKFSVPPASISLNGDRFVLGLKGCKYDFVCDGQWTRVAENSSDLLTGDWYDESLIAASKNTDYPPINVSPGYINGYKILANDLCTGGRQTWRLMTMKDQAYQLAYLQHEDRPDIMKIGISKAFESMKAAIADTSKIVLNNCIKLYSKERSSSTPAALSDWQKNWSDDIYDFRISDDNKRILYQGKWWDIEQVEQVQTNLPVPLYRLALQIGKEMTAIYLMPVNSSELLLSTETNLPVEGSQVLISSIGTFHKLTLKSGEVNLPQSLNEIWHGGTSNRLININLAKTTLYYSTGDKKTYGTYRIDETMSTGKLTRIITRAGNEYQVFFLRNIQAYSFELSVCQNRYKSKAEARLINESYCDKFNRMTLHYEQDSSKIFLPFNPAMMEAGNRQKIDRLLSETGNPANQSIAGQTTGTLYYNSSFGWEIPDKMPIQITRTVKLTAETPFDRSYVQYDIKRPTDKFSISNNLLYFYGKQVNYMATPNSGANYVPEYIVIHSSASTSAKGTINWFLNPQSKAATHILIDRDGNITQFAPFNKVVYHAGPSEWDGKSGLNRYSIGIDLINAGSLTRKGKDWVNVAGQIVPGNEVDIIKGKGGENDSAWHNYTREQINTLSEICKVLRETYSIQAVLGHSEISRNKEADPGPAFPIEKFK